MSDAYDKVKFYKLAWDAVGSEFASRHTQYEMFYAGATFVTKAHSYRTYDWSRATDLVDRVLAGYDLAPEAALDAGHRAVTASLAPGVVPIDTNFRAALERMRRARPPASLHRAGRHRISKSPAS